LIQERLRGLLAEAIEELRRDGVIPNGVTAPAVLQRPARPEHGDFSTNVALVLSGELQTPPRALADRIVQALPDAGWVAKVTVAGPGFINFFLTHAWLQDTLRDIARLREQYGRWDTPDEVEDGKANKIQVEFVSANPTGPLHVGAGRNAAYGDALASLLEAAGHSVDREYYINDAGRQIDLFGRSLEARYLQSVGREAELPADGYAGQYVVDLGAELAEARGDELVGRPEDIRAWGVDRMLEGIKATLERFGVRFDTWFSEQVLHDTGKLIEALGRLQDAGLTYELDGAVWFRSTEFGDSRDRVLVRSDGRPTYLMSDTAYLIDKVERGFDHAVYVWGADHHGAVASLEAVRRALKLPIVVEILLYQLVNLYSGGEVVRMSKRTGEIVTLDELIDEVGADAARFTFLLRSLDGALDFDLDLVKAKSQENPVYYVQYAYARICSILRTGAERGIALGPIEEAPLAELVHESEQALARMLSEYPETVQVAARLRAPHRLTTYTRELAALFHAFYRDCRVISDDPLLTQARLWLAEATRQVLANALAVLGVGAPERM
jgi:arginyl-tRNA synthetase